VKDVRLKPVEIEALCMPTYRAVYYRLAANVPEESIRSVLVVFQDERGTGLARREAKFSQGEQKLDLPELKAGTYRLVVSVTDRDGKRQESDTFTYERKVFAWENNTLGVTREVYPPFEAIRTAEDTVRVVERTCKMNHFGLWDSVISKERELLAGPMALRCLTDAGEAAWQKTTGKFTVRRGDLAVYESGVQADALKIKTTSSVEPDSCMKVEMQLLPGGKPAEIKKLWIDIPLKASEAPLFHEVTDGPRINYAGRTPEGEGVVWDSTKARRYRKWQNSFVPYIWLGAEERGLAWFAENDKGWITQKGEDATPTQELIREGDTLTLRVYLINKPAAIEEPHALVFGLQASPTKPMPKDWRARLADIPGGLAVVPWGGLHCSYQTPYRNDWAIVDKIAEARHTGKVDRAWFEQYAREHNPPPAYGTWPWLSNVLHFAGRNVAVGPDKPLAVYQEEMAASTLREEWPVYGDEWTPAAHDYTKGQRTVTDEEVMRRGTNANPSAGITFSESYRDFGCWVANEWLKRGVSLYWDNTYPHTSYNFRTTDAYVTETGEVQPCLILWNQREYQKRVWNLLQQWRPKRKEPLEWTHHMTNTLVLPIHTWGTADLDHELSSTKPFSPDWLRTEETIGLQIGNYPLSLYPVTGRGNKVIESAPKDIQERAEWGMRAVHEIQRGGKLEDLLHAFGYATSQVRVHNYWEEKPALTVGSNEVKWMLLEKPKDGQILLVLSSWSEGAENVEVAINHKHIAARIAGRLTDAEMGDTIAEDLAKPFRVKFASPYGVRVLKTVR